MKTPVGRIIAFVLMFIAVVVLPWWLSALLLVTATIYFSLYLEVLFFGFLFDTLYSAQVHFPYNALTAGLVLFLVVSFVRTRVRMSS